MWKDYVFLHVFQFVRVTPQLMTFLELQKRLWRTPIQTLMRTHPPRWCTFSAVGQAVQTCSAGSQSRAVSRLKPSPSSCSFAGQHNSQQFREMCAVLPQKPIQVLALDLVCLKVLLAPLLRNSSLSGEDRDNSRRRLKGSTSSCSRKQHLLWRFNKP